MIVDLRQYEHLLITGFGFQEIPAGKMDHNGRGYRPRNFQRDVFVFFLTLNEFSL